MKTIDFNYRISKNEKGITLIALIVTTVVLLILAGISIGALTGDEGLISKSKDARNSAIEMQESTTQDREDLYGEIIGNKTDYGQAGEVGVNLTLKRSSETSITASATATGIKSEIISYTFFIRKATENDSAYVMIKKADKLTNTATCTGLEKDMSYKVKVVAMDKDGVSNTAEQSILLGDIMKIAVTPISEPDSYPSITKVVASSAVSNMDYIEMPNGEKIYAENGKFELKTTYNATKNGPLTFTAYDKDGNTKQLNYMEQNVINFETEWTFDSANTTVTVPVRGTAVDVYIDYGDGTKENITSANPTHTYTTAGTYTMKISGRCDEFAFNTSTQNYLTRLKKWGVLENRSYRFGGYISGVGSVGCEKLVGNIPEPHEKSFAKITTFSQTFFECSGLTGSIPENLFANCPNVTSFYGTFWCCNKLTGNIPENLFANCQNVTTFYGTFIDCSGLTGSIPEKLFANCSNVKSFENTFNSCSELTGSIPEQLFANCPKVTTFSTTFSSCSGLTGSIPEQLFAKCPNVTDFTQTFTSCSGLTGNIPEQLFAKCQNVTTFSNTFSSCRGLTGNIPENLFANCPNVTSFSSTFNGCIGLTGSIPENLFANCQNVTNFFGTFGSCQGLTGEIPERLFVNCPNVTDFGWTFISCEGLTGNIPENLFSNCPNVTSFRQTFWACKGLTGGIPERLFSNCPNVTSFDGTFQICSKLTGEIPENLFSNCPKVINFSSTFYSCSGLTGNAPELWTRVPDGATNGYKGTPDGDGCFYGCTKLTNYSSIPDYWK